MSRADALAHLQAGRPQAAAALLESQLRLESADAQDWFLLGACRHALNDLAGAATAFSRSRDIDPANPEAHLALVTVLRAAGDACAALVAAQQALAHLPGDARVLYAAALSFEDLGQADAALAHYDRVLASCGARSSPLLRAAGLPELVAADQDSYVALALQLASDPSRLAAYRRRLAARAGPLFDTATRVRELETAFVQVWQQGPRRA